MRSKKSSLTVSAGLGVGLLGALALAIRFGGRNPLRKELPDTISPAIFATKVLNTSGGEIVYHTSGTGDPLLFLHGVFPGASSYEWSNVYPHFAQTHHVLVPDLIGFGESQRPRPAIHAEAHVRALADFFHATCKNHTVTIIASGLSANLALLFASRFPEYVARLVFWMPLFVWQKKISLIRSTHLAWFPRLARIAYRRQLSTEDSIRQWLLRSGFPTQAASLEEVVTVLTSTAQQYGAEHAFLAQSTRSFWQKMRCELTPIYFPISLLVARGSEQLTTEGIAHLRPYSSRLSINEVETNCSLAPLSEPQMVIPAIEHELLTGV